MSSGYHNRNHNQRRDSPSSNSSSRPRSNSKTSDPVHKNRQQQQQQQQNCNGKMPSAAPGSTTSHSEQITDGVAGLALENLKYPVGSKVTAKFKNGSISKGEVVAYDPIAKVVILKASGGRPGHNNVTLVNILHCSDIKVDEEGRDAPGELPSLNLGKLQQRLKDNIVKKKKLIMAFKAGISPEGQKLFQVINKTIDDVTWDKDKILVLNEVTIEPPYRPDTIRAKEDSKALKYIKQIVEKFISDEEAAKVSTPVTATASSGPPASTPTVSTASSSSPPPPEAPATSTASSSSRPPSNATSPNPNSSATSSQHGPPPQSKGSGSRGQNRNNPGRNANRQHHEHHAKPMYNN